MNRVSWVDSANLANTDFPLDNLPFGVFRRASGDVTATIGVAIGNQILDLRRAAHEGLLRGLSAEVIRASQATYLNDLMALGRGHWSALRTRLLELLGAGEHRRDVERHLVNMSDAVMQLPAAIGDYTDFYASLYHATNVGSLFRPDSPLLPNYKYLPIGYHGRASSIVPSGTPVPRPAGQTRQPGEPTPRFGPSQALDYELEVGFFIGPGNPLGEPIPIEAAESHIFGLCLVNDWSARDIQAWEYQPLGPFLGKNFATTISPWVVTLEALEPFRAPAFSRPPGDPEPLPYLLCGSNRQSGGFDVTLEVLLSSRRMRQAALEPMRLCRANLRDLYWTPAQLVAHHSSNGCNLRPGDLLASGTVSGAGDEALGSLLELTRRGSRPVALPTSELRGFLEDGDEVTLRGRLERGDLRLGFGECRGMVGS